MTLPPRNPNVLACPWCDKTRIGKRKGKNYCWMCKQTFKEPIERPPRGARRARPEDMEVLTEEEMYTKLTLYNPKDYPHTMRDRAFVAGLDKTGARINEFLGTKETPPLTLSAIQWVSPTEIKVKLPVLKRRMRVNKTPPVILDSDRIAPFFFNYIKSFGEPNYSDEIELKKWKETPLFPFKRTRGLVIVKKILGKQYFPHFMRHQCITELIGTYDFSDTQTVNFTGMADARTLIRYAHLRTSDLSAKIRQKIKK